MRTLAVVLGLAACGGVIAANAACDSSARVGELRAEPVPVGPLVPGEPDAGAALETSWRRHAPTIPCTIYAMGEVRADRLYLGCNGGRIYRFDGVKAFVELEVEEDRIFSLLWVAPNGEVWAGAQLGFSANAPTQLYHFDGVQWSKRGDATRRITSITGSLEGDVWVTTDSQILRYQGASAVVSFTAPSGKFRGCAFLTSNQGYCVGTAGLVVAWNGEAWSPMAGAPWTPAAEVFGVEIEPFTKAPTFFYGETIEDPHGTHACRIARASGATFTSFAASTPCFPRASLARKRTGQVNVNGRTYMLLAVDEAYGHSLLFDTAEDAVRPMCGPIMAFSTGLANTRAGGKYGLLATIVGSGGSQIALSSVNGAAGSSMDFDDLSVAPDGTAWARVEDATACGSSSKRIVRFDGAWQPVAGPQGALSGRGLVATSHDHAYTIDIGGDSLLVHHAGNWTEGPELESGWSIGATARDDVWIGGTRDNLAHYDGTALESVRPVGRVRQVEQVVPTEADVWMVVQGVTAGDTDVHVVRHGRASGKVIEEWNLGLQGSNVHLSALDATHVFQSGAPAQAWDGTRWKALDFDASGVWARAEGEVYFTDGGDIWRWDGARRERVYRGSIPIFAIHGAKGRGFAVGPGGLTIELAAWPPATK